jgi:hypothetical protein
MPHNRFNHAGTHTNHPVCVACGMFASHTMQHIPSLTTKTHAAALAQACNTRAALTLPPYACECDGFVIHIRLLACDVQQL